MIKRTELGYTTKLIDFDSSYIVGNPPSPQEIVGTMNYYSPELVRYIQQSSTPGDLTESADIFALGLIYAEYLTGSMPAFDPVHHEAAIAVLHGQILRLGPSRAPEAVVALVERMLLPEAGARPSVAEVHATLMGLRNGSGTPARTRARAPMPVRPPLVTRESMSPSASPPSVPTEPGRTPRAPSHLRGKGVRIAGSSDPTVAPDLPYPSAPRPTASAGRQPLMGKLLGRLDERRTP